MPSNRLIREKSPYLLQHAHNPVDWHPWGEQAFRKAREEDKPIFLSIGYSTCHWCHVMERESFENETTAEMLNRHFVSIKVDREERPDVDRIYMTFVQATTGSGGWPMSVFLTPDLQPFFGGTYFPPENRHGRPGFPFVLERVAEAWRMDRERIRQSGNEVVTQLTNAVRSLPEPAALDASILQSGYQAFRRMFDTKHGGFGGAPKFPRPSVNNFLLRFYERTGNLEALDMVFATLNAMSRGGMHDQLGGGFHRYAVDERWFVPHFEKMLYDQAQLAISYLEGFQIAGDEYYAGVARKTLDYVLREMTDKEGGFYSAEDADSVIAPARPDEKGEGAFYVWTQSEIENALGQPAAAWFCYQYGVEPAGNVRHDPQGEFRGKNVLYVAHPADETAAHFGKTREEIERSLEASANKLLEQRGRRVRPHLDDKVLTAWNGLMISAFAKAARVLEEPRYLEAARRAAAFLQTRCYRPETGLLRRYREGEAAIAGFLDDYAFFVQGLLDLYEADFDLRDLELALELTEKQRALFEDKQRGGFFSTAAGETDLVIRLKDDYDGAEPSGNSIAALNLLRLAQITDRNDLRNSAERTMAAFAATINSAPEAVPQMLVALALSLSKPKQIVLAGEKHHENTRALLRAVNRRFLPSSVVLLVGDEETRRKLAGYMPAIQAMSPINGVPAAYVCEDYTCKLPITDAAQFSDSLGRAA